MNNSRLESALDHIAVVIKDSLPYIGLNGGALLNTSGISIFLYHYGQIRKDAHSIRLSSDILNQVFSSDLPYSKHKSSTTSFCSGLAGTGWLAMYMKDKGAWESSLEMREMDELIFEFYRESIEKGFHDFLHGASGALLYMLKRKSKSSQIKSNEMINSLLDIAYAEDDLFFWNDYDLEKNLVKKSFLNYGLSHGTPAILSILSKAKTVNYEKVDHLKDLVQLGVNTLLKYKNDEGSMSRYPYNVNIDEPSNQFTRLGWCYGDLGVAQALWNTASFLKDHKTLSTAYDIVIASTNRTFKDSVVQDGGICHGASGISHIYHRFYKRTKNMELLKASDYWMDVALEMIEPRENLITGHTKYTHTEGYVNSFGLLDGISGVGLTILDRLSDKKLNWDECLLIS
ncbi:lanthionine synthetase C family protein [Sphingobacterium sp.]|uniref:lanthionine synthetase C family protein n=1 Tax=Sphingobacterium sp. TaxID=341027 RepID=UPI002897271A|nr:lanthionine synthetase C family protein [Sphingobacterium sp.]